MSAWAFCLAYNEAPFIAYWVRHYITFCDKVIIYLDKDTDDGSDSIATSEGAEVRVYTGDSGIDDIVFANFASEAYREVIGQSDWVIWADADELVYHPQIQSRLEELHAAGITLPVTEQYVMSSTALPTHPGQVYDHPDFRRGFHIPGGSKVALFNPNELSVHWSAGKHAANVDGNKVRDDDTKLPIQILHYRWLGEAYLLARDAKNYARLSRSNRDGGMGYHVWPTFVGPYQQGWVGPKPADALDVLS